MNEPKRILMEYLLGFRDPEKAASLFADDGVFEMPYPRFARHGTALRRTWQRPKPHIGGPRALPGLEVRRQGCKGVDRYTHSGVRRVRRPSDGCYDGTPGPITCLWG